MRLIATSLVLLATVPAPGSASAAQSSGNISSCRAAPRVTSDIFNGVLNPTLGAGSYSWQFIDTRGRVLDAGEAACRQ
jgi:hypothetical protein